MRWQGGVWSGGSSRTCLHGIYPSFILALLLFLMILFICSFF